MSEKAILVVGSASRPRMVLEREIGSSEAVDASAAISVANTTSTFAQYHGRAGWYRCSSHTIAMHARLRHAKTMEWSRNSGQMREPSLMRTFGSLNTSEVQLRHRCMQISASVAAVPFPNPMSPSGLGITEMVR